MNDGSHDPPHAFFLVGTTASGKSAVVQHVAERRGWRVVSADSMNLYRGMDIGTAKPTREERERVDYAGIDLVDPSGKFSVAAYLEAVRPAFGTDHETIVAGGTGLYIKCLTQGFDDVPPENEALRAELEALEFHDLEQRAQTDAAALYGRLTADDRRNPRRLIRILEKAREEARPAGGWNSRPKPTLVGLQVGRETLHRRIAGRVERMYAAGLLEEAHGLMGMDLSPTALQAIGYAEAFAVLRREISLEEAKEKTIIRTRRLAKRQMTWFRNQLQVEWIDVERYPSMEKLAEAVAQAWDALGPTRLAM